MSYHGQKAQEGIQPIHTEIDKLQWRLRTHYSEKTISVEREGESLIVALAPEQFKSMMTVFRRDPKFEYDYLSFITGIDFIDAIDLVYTLYSFENNSWLRIKVSLDHNSPTIETVCDLWSSANWHERECFDLLGVKFDGHPNLTKILTTDEIEGHPLRKDFKEGVGKLWLVRKIKRLP